MVLADRRVLASFDVNGVMSFLNLTRQAGWFIAHIHPLMALASRRALGSGLPE
jgi:hypothetical protein